MNYTKQPLDYADIISMLKSRGLVISDENKALECLKRVSYFRLANYFHPMEKDKVNHIFKPNSKFDNAIETSITLTATALASLFCRSVSGDWTAHENDSSHFVEKWRILVH